MNIESFNILSDYTEKKLSLNETISFCNYLLTLNLLENNDENQFVNLINIRLQNKNLLFKSLFLSVTSIFFLRYKLKSSYITSLSIGLFPSLCFIIFDFQKRNEFEKKLNKLADKYKIRFLSFKSSNNIFEINPDFHTIKKENFRTLEMFNLQTYLINNH